MATIKEILEEFHRHKPRFNAIRTSSGWQVLDIKPKCNRVGGCMREMLNSSCKCDTDPPRTSVVARDTDGEKIARLVKLLNGASDVNE